MLRRIIEGILVCMLFACHEDMPLETSSRTVLVYMAGDNSLDYWIDENIEAMMQGMEKLPGNLVLYVDGLKEAPKLIQLGYEKGKAVRRVIRNYPEESSGDPQTLSRVMQETRELFPADSYGLILWSHGMGWFPREYSFPGSYRMLSAGRPRLQTKFFTEDKHLGEKGGVWGMQLEELAEALPHDLSFILFDACFMGSVEVVYQLRDCAEYIISSPAEILAEGFPYSEILPLLFGGEAEFRQICRKCRDYYQRDARGTEYQSATVSLVKTSELEALAQQARQILRGRQAEIAALPADKVWRYPLIDVTTDVFYDLGDFIRNVATPEQYKVFRAQLEKTVVYKAMTRTFFGETVRPEQFSGLTSWLPLQRWENMLAYYEGLDWTAAVY